MAREIAQLQSCNEQGDWDVITGVPKELVYNRYFMRISSSIHSIRM